MPPESLLHTWEQCDTEQTFRWHRPKDIHKERQIELATPESHKEIQELIDS